MIARVEWNMASWRHLRVGVLPRRATARWRRPASISRSLTSSSDSTAHDILKKDFRRWLGREVQILVGLTVVGVAGITLYQNRESAPARQVARLLDGARVDAKQEDRAGALRKCLKAYTIVKSTNPQDRHLFELAFTVAAQYETIGNVHQATKYYLDAFANVPYVRDVTERDLNRVVVLDRIAQCYQDQGEQRAAENYYRQAIEAYDKRQQLNQSSNGAELTQIDLEIPAVLFNYGQQLSHLKRWNEARVVLKRAHSAAISANVSGDYIARIERLLQAANDVDDDSENEHE